MPARNAPEPPTDTAIVTATALGVIGGLFVAKTAMEQMFVEGLSAEERKGVFILAAVAATGIAAKQLFDIDERWVNIERFAQEPGELPKLPAWVER